MALIGPTPTVASVSSLIQNSSKSELFEVFEEVVQYTDGTILTSLAANSSVRPKLIEFLTPEKLEDSFDLLKTTSDPNFVALSWLADEVDALRPTILKLITQKPMIKGSLTVLTRLMAKNKLDIASLDNEVIEQVFPWLRVTTDNKTSDDGDSKSNKNSINGGKSVMHWQTLADIFVKAAVPSHSKFIVSYVKGILGNSDKVKEIQDEGQDNLSVDLSVEQSVEVAFAVVRATYESLPELVDLVLSYPEASIKPSDDLFYLLSAVCNSKDTRDKVVLKFSSIISEEADKNNQIAAVVEAKILAGTTSQTGDIEKAAKRLDDLSANIFEGEIDETLLEGLACSVMLLSVRNRIANQGKGGKAGNVISKLTSLLKKSPGTTGYAIFVILFKLAKFPIKPTKEEEHKNKLRIEALGKSLSDLEEELDLANEDIKFHARQQSGKICDQITQTSILTWISTNITKFSFAGIEQLAYLLRELAAHQERNRREQLSMQGTIVIAMYLWTTTSPKPLDAHMKAVAASSVSKLLATVAPQVALTDKIDKRVVVPTLCSQIHNDNSDRTNLDTFEALRALTNLASIDDNRLKLVISTTAWPRLPAALNSEFLQIRRSSLELICNLMMVPRSAEHFLQGNADSTALLSLLGRSLTVDDEDSRLAAAGALAILSEWETAPERIGHNKDCVEGLSRCLGLFPDDDPLLLRVLIALNTIIKVTAREMDDEVVESIVFNEGLAHLEELVDTLDPVAHNEVARLVLQCIKLIAEYKYKGTV